MDKTTVITVLFNSIATIITTAIVVRISLGKPVIFFGESARNFFQRYWFVGVGAFIFIVNIAAVVNFLFYKETVSRTDIVFMPISTLAILIYPFLIAEAFRQARKARPVESAT